MEHKDVTDWSRIVPQK